MRPEAHLAEAAAQVVSSDVRNLHKTGVGEGADGNASAGVPGGALASDLLSSARKEGLISTSPAGGWP